MIGSRSTRWLRELLVGGLLVWGLPHAASAAPPGQLPPGLTVPVPHLKVLDLATARALALEKQPAIAAARASLSASLARKQAVDNLRVPTCLQPDLPIRRKQAALGPVAAQAGVLLAEINTVYAVQYTYLSYLYALSQRKLAENSLARLEELDKVLTEVVLALEKKAKDPDSDFDTELLPADRERIRAMMRLTEGRRDEAILGACRALSALREALHLQEECQLTLAHDGLLDADVELDCKALVELALAHRPEIIATSVAYEVGELEVAAQQCRKRGLSVRTFASGTDIHVQPLPPGSFQGDYKPQAVGPEMPTTINGRQCDRVAVASSYHDRSGAVVEKTRNLVRLEVEQAFLRYQEAHAKLRRFEDGIRHIAKATAGLQEKLDLGRGSRARLESLLNTGLLGSQLRMQANEVRYEMLIALVTLERATAGTFCAGLDHAPPAPAMDQAPLNMKEKMRQPKRGKDDPKTDGTAK